MNIKLYCIGKTTDKNIDIVVCDYVRRLQHYVNFSIEIIEPKKKKLGKGQSVEEEGELLLKKISPQTNLILLDESGKNYVSTEYAQFIQKQLNNSTKEIVFIIGGAYGFSPKVYQRANAKVALSKMTFTHQMVRMVFVEQLYRAFTIIKGEKYHH